jgi:hypothetical protein
MSETLTNAQILGAWISIFLTLCTLSFLYDDNPFYKLAEHLFIGTSIGIIVTKQVHGVLIPNLFDRLVQGQWSYLIALALSLMLFAKVIPGKSWMAAFPIAFVVGVYSGRSIPAYAQAVLLTQLHYLASFDLTTGGWAVIAGRAFMTVGVICGLAYFYFSRPHTGALGVVGRAGVWVLMIAFGASFGYTVQGRIALLIGRFQELLGLDKAKVVADQIHAPAVSIVCTLFIAGTLVYWASRRDSAQD